ncbi:hypothetical protein [Peptostreptococcus faecalis]|nr:hypothetical protein [Peptostreptococcus faecalis]
MCDLVIPKQVVTSRQVVLHRRQCNVELLENSRKNVDNRVCADI